MHLLAILLVAVAGLTALLAADRVDGFEIKPLDEFINYYEPVVFQTQSEFPTLIAQNSDLGSKTKKGALSTERVEIRAFGRTFNLLLTRTSKILASNADITVLASTSGCVPQRIRTEDFLAHLVEGEVCDEQDSFVHGTWRAGVFNGAIHIKNNTYFVEKATKYFHEKVPFDSVMFRMEDLNMTAFDCMGTDGEAEGHCDPIQLLQKVGPKTLEVKPVKEQPPEETSTSSSSNILWFNRGKKNTCHLKLVADHLFYQNAGDGFLYNAVYEMIFHVSEANLIFRNTDFDGDGEPDLVGFQIEALEITASPECAPYPAANKAAVTSDQYLEQFSEHDLQNYCVGVAFSGCTFPGRVLGIAWMADSESGGYVGGICEPRLFSTNDQKALSFNSAVITIMLEGRRVPRGITAIAVAHELGHSFGSDHDPYQDPICSPSKEDGGKYIMAAYAVKGDRPNNRYFSPCSKRSMSTVLTKKSSCFGIGASVSNDVDDVGVETVDNEVENLKESLELTNDDDNDDNDDGAYDCYRCMFEETEDSMSEECCRSPTCKVIHSETKKPIFAQVEDSSDCVFPSGECESDPAQCPAPEYRPDGTSCNEGRGVCREGCCIIEEENSLESMQQGDNDCVICCHRHHESDFADDESIDATCITLKRSERPWLANKKFKGILKGCKCECDHSNEGPCDPQGKCGRRVPPTVYDVSSGNKPDEAPPPSEEARDGDFKKNEGHESTGDAPVHPPKKMPEGDKDPLAGSTSEQPAIMPAIPTEEADDPSLNTDQGLQNASGKKGKSEDEEIITESKTGGLCDLYHIENCERLMIWIVPGLLVVLAFGILTYLRLHPFEFPVEKRSIRESPPCKLAPASTESSTMPVFYRPSRNMASLDLACRNKEDHDAPNAADQARSKSL